MKKIVLKVTVEVPDDYILDVIRKHWYDYDVECI